MKPKDLKIIVQEKYSEVVTGSKKAASTRACCGQCDCDTDWMSLTDRYKTLPGYHADADFGLGCGIPTQYANISRGQHVLDLGSGAGNDCFVVRSLVGDNGKVTGIDFTDAMVEKANVNLQKLGYTNIEFIKGDIENMPLSDNSFDVVISNCVLNLVPDKEKSYKEIYRVLKQNGHFCISDIVLKGTLPKKIQEAAEMYAGCVSGATNKENYLEIIRSAGFKDIEIKNENEIQIPDKILASYLNNSEIETYNNSGASIFSITVTAKK
jgi:arsenite methyltransferase